MPIVIHSTLEMLLNLVSTTEGASDLHFKPDTAPRIRVKGTLCKVGSGNFSPDQVHQMVVDSMPPALQEQFAATNEADFAIEIPSGARFRANAFKTRGRTGLVARILVDSPKSLSELDVPTKVNHLAQSPNGLILVTGATGSGKTTTLSGMVDEINRTKQVHILTIEDPIEILHKDIEATVSQRELYSDTQSFPTALRAGLREDPDVILVGELRDSETAKVALHAAETGHLVLSTLHTNSAPETINRLIKMFPAEEHEQVRMTLAETLRGVVCQRLVPTLNNKRIPVIEILSNEGRVPDAILDPQKYDLREIIERDHAYGMQSFEQHLVELVRDRVISEETALRHTTQQHDLKLKFKHM